jgi:hypothetical protein
MSKSNVIEIPADLFRRLQALAIPLEDTVLTVLDRAVACYEQHQLPRNGEKNRSDGNRPNGEESRPEADRQLVPESPDSLSHTKVLAAQVGRHSATKWNGLMVAAHRAAIQSLGGRQELLRQTIARAVEGRKEDDGYHYIPDLDISIQYVDSHGAWRNALHLAKRVRLPISVEFVWRENPNAQYPGERGSIRWQPE